MLRDVYLPEVINGSHSNGNRELSMMEAAVGISVFLEDKASYDKAMATFRTRTAAYVYLYGTDVGARLRHGLGFPRYQLGAAAPGCAPARSSSGRSPRSATTPWPTASDTP